MDNQIEIINLGFVNCYLINTGKDFILVDTGISFLREKLEKQLILAGCNKENLKLIILTHGDIDHSGNSKYLREKYGPRIAVHKNDIIMVEKGEFYPDRKVNSTFMKIMQFIMGLNNGFEKMISQFEVFTPDIVLEGNEKLNSYGIDAEITHIPGHTDGSICILFKSGDLICGDTMQNNKSAVIVKDEKELINSITKLSKHNLNIIYPGHGKPFKWNGKIIKQMKMQYKY